MKKELLKDKEKHSKRKEKNRWAGQCASKKQISGTNGTSAG